MDDSEERMIVFTSDKRATIVTRFRRRRHIGMQKKLENATRFVQVRSIVAAKWTHLKVDFISKGSEKQQVSRSLRARAGSCVTSRRAVRGAETFQAVSSRAGVPHEPTGVVFAPQPASLKTKTALRIEFLNVLRGRKSHDAGWQNRKIAHLVWQAATFLTERLLSHPSTPACFSLLAHCTRGLCTLSLCLCTVLLKAIQSLFFSFFYNSQLIHFSLASPF